MTGAAINILAIDQGTTSTRALVMNGTGNLSQVLSLPHRRIYPAPGHVEHEPEELLANVARGLAAADGAVAGGGDSDGRPVSPVIVWQDDRTASTAVEAEGAAPEVTVRAGLPLDRYFSASTPGWILRHIPRARDIAAAGHLRPGTTDAYFRDRLTGRFQTDVATASRTSLMNLETGERDAELCRLFGVPLSALPEIDPTSGDLGTIPGGVPLCARHRRPAGGALRPRMPDARPGESDLRHRRLRAVSDGGADPPRPPRSPAHRRRATSGRVAGLRAGWRRLCGGGGELGARPWPVSRPCRDRRLRRHTGHRPRYRLRPGAGWPGLPALEPGRPRSLAGAGSGHGARRPDKGAARKGSPCALPRCWPRSRPCNPSRGRLRWTANCRGTPISPASLRRSRAMT